MKRIIGFCFLIAFSAALSSAFAGTKEDMMRIEKDLDQLKQQIMELDKSFNKSFIERTDGIKSLVIQLNDQVAKSSLVLDKILARLDNLDVQNDKARSADEALLQEVRKLSTKLNTDVTTRLSDISAQLSAISRQLEISKVQTKAIGPETPSGGIQTPEAMYAQAWNDFVQGKIDLAIQEFNAFYETYPVSDKTPMALLNLGEAYLRQNKLALANIAFTRVINNYPETTKVPSALYKRAQVELSMHERQNAIDDLQTIIDKYPAAPEVHDAKAKLQELDAGTAKPAPPAITPILPLSGKTR
jgi:tol-pal system protein YbgF